MVHLIKFCLIFLFVLSGCSLHTEDKESSEFYILYKRMYERLDSLQVSLEKHIVRNKEYEKVLIHADSIDFQKELEFFIR